MMTESCLRSLKEGTLLLWRGQTLTLVEVTTYRGQVVVWTEEVNGPLPPAWWAEMELLPEEVTP